jgi:hypothetical protein
MTRFISIALQALLAFTAGFVIAVGATGLMAKACAAERVTGCHDNPPTMECPPPPEGRITPNWRNYGGATTQEFTKEPVPSAEHILMRGGAWGDPFKMVCERPGDAVITVGDRAKCVGVDNKPYEPEFQRPVGNDWVFCNPYDTSGYNSCTPQAKE